jgi:hypothetical protein
MIVTPEEKEEILRKIAIWVKSPEGKKALDDTLKKSSELFNKPNHPQCECCYCRSNRLIG